MWKRLRRIDYRHWIALAVLLGTVSLGVFVYKYPFYRLLEGIADLVKAVVYCFANFYEKAHKLSFEQTVNEFSKVDLQYYIGIDLEEIYRRLTCLKDEIFVLRNFTVYLVYVMIGFCKFLCIVCYVVIFGLILFMPVFLFWDEVNNDYNEDTKPLQWFKHWVNRPFKAAKAWLGGFFAFFRSSSWWTCFVVIWLLYFGFWTVILEFLAYYFWVLTVFDFSTIKIQLLKLVADLLLCFNTLPWPCWVAIGIWIYDRWRLGYGTRKLYHLDSCNKEVLEKVPMCNYIVAMPRTGKDMMMNSMALTFASMDRDTCLGILNDNMKRFPRFPWIMFELWLQDHIKNGSIRSWVSARDLTLSKCVFYDCFNVSDRYWCYDIEKYPFEFNDGLKVIRLPQALAEYAQAYFSYTLTTSYLVSNAPARDDFIINDQGNFVLVDTDYLNRRPEDIPEVSKYSHIIDWDMFRLGVKMMEKNPNVGAFEFGILVLTEIDKERKNNDQLKETKAKDEGCNQKNDLFNLWMKMSGHGAMLANKCLLHVLTNAQRPSSWGADGHELCAVMHIEKHTGQTYTLPFFWLEASILKRFLSWWDGVFNESRYNWGNHHLFTWLGQGLAAILYRYLTRRGNLYGYYDQPIQCETGTSDEHKNFEDMTYRVIFRTAYAERYASDYFKAFANMQTERCEVGMNELPTYTGKYPTIKEMQLSHSHLNQDLFKYHGITIKEPVVSYEYTDENLNPDEFPRKE